MAIFDHPQNFRHPTWWMVRSYGLFAANPFGWHDFENLKDEPHKGDHTIPAGGSLTLRYRFYFQTPSSGGTHALLRHVRLWDYRSERSECFDEERRQ